MAADPKDTEFINQLLNGDKNALYLLYDKYSGALYGVILRMCREEDLAKDLLQESFIKIWNLKQSFKRVDFEYVPREKNKLADKLVNQAIDEANK